MMRAATDNLAILLTDIEDFTPKTSRKTRADILRMIDEHKALVLPVLEGKGGRLIKTIGDAFLVVFESPTDAVLAGVEVQRLLREYNADKQGDDRLDVRIAINSGEVTLADNDVFGEPVNITARINGIAEAGEVFFTEAVYLAMNKMEVPSSEVGLLQLKGIAEKIRVYKVVREKPIGETSGGGYADTAAAPSTRSAADTAAAEPPQHGAGSPAAPAPAVRPEPGAAWQPAGRRRRVVALVLDALFCAFFLALLLRTPGPFDFDIAVDTEVNERDKTAAADAGAAAAGVTIDSQGVRVGDDIVSGQGEMRVGQALRIDESGVKVDSSKLDQKTLDEIALLIDALLERRRQEAELAGSTLLSCSLLWFVYSAFFLTVWSATPAKRLLGIRIVRSDGSPLDWKVAISRSLFSLVSSNFLMLGYIWGFFSKDRRTWHDRIAGSRAVLATD